MTRTTHIFIAGAVLLTIGAGFLAYSHSSRATASSPANRVVAEPQKIIHHVALTDRGAEPSDLLIKTGEYVQFDSKDGKVHDIASGAGDGDGEHHDHSSTGVESGEFKPDEGYLVQFNQIGSYFFHDHLHPTLTISVAVYAPEASSTGR